MERRIGFLERVSGHTYDTIYDLLFTTERVITLMVQHPTEVPHQFGITELLFGGLVVRKTGEIYKGRHPTRRGFAPMRKRPLMSC